MKKKSIVFIAILLIAGLTGLRLYKKHKKAQIIAEQEAIQREQNEKLLQQQKEAQMAKYQEEERRKNDSIANAQSQKLNEGLQMLKEARESLNQ